MLLPNVVFKSCTVLLVYSDAGGYRIVGCPKSIQDKKYARNALIFNFVFIFEVEADTSPFEPVIQKIGEAFKIYEVSFDVYLLLHR